MINKKNWQLMKNYLDYRLRVDQITEGSMGKERTHLRYVLEWAQDTSFHNAPALRPTLPEYLLSGRLDGEKGQLSAVYIKKVLATARMFFIWLVDNNSGYTQLKQGWIKTIKAKRLSDIPYVKDFVTLDEILSIARSPVHTVQERRTRAALVFLYLSGMRVGAFVSLPVQAVDISNRSVNQYASLGVRTKNSKSAKTYLLDIPELLQVVQAWHNEIVRASSLFWFAPISPQTGELDPSISQVGFHRINLARRNFRDWLASVGQPYHSPHKFRHGHIHYGLQHSKDISDFKAVSANVMHSSMKITDQFYSVLGDDEVKNRIGALGETVEVSEDDLIKKFKKFLDWDKSQEK